MTRCSPRRNAAEDRCSTVVLHVLEEWDDIRLEGDRRLPGLEAQDERVEQSVGSWVSDHSTGMVYGLHRMVEVPRVVYCLI